MSSVVNLPFYTSKFVNRTNEDKLFLGQGAFYVPQLCLEQRGGI